MNTFLSDECLDDFAMHVGQTKVAASIAMG